MMKQAWKAICRLVFGENKEKSREELRQEYLRNKQKYDHYNSFGSAFMNICSSR